jgi:hypothetical protein
MPDQTGADHDQNPPHLRDPARKDELIIHR